MSLRNKTVLVTGAATGIGAAVAAAFAAQGSVVYGADNAWTGDLAGDGVTRVRCDVADEVDVQRCVTDIEKRHGAVDVLVNNAAMSSSVLQKPFEEIAVDEFTRVIRNNTLAPFLCTKAVATKMRERKQGRVINLTSSTVFLGVPNVLHYVSSKGAVMVMTRALARELGSDGITVNAVAPGLTMTEGMLDNSTWSPEIRAAVVAGRCLQREEQADDLVGACLFLADDGAAFMTGQILTVDGGNAFH